jgi:chromosome partitioning protein
MGLIKTINELVLHERGAYLLSDRLIDYPLPHDVVIMDCPATLGPLPLIAVSACTHLIIPIQVEPKSVDAASLLLEWSYHTFRRLRLKPEPIIMGVVPCQYDARVAIHRNLLQALTPQLAAINIRCFPPIRYSAEFKNASSVGLPIQLYRQLHQACKDFNPIVSEIVKELHAGREGYRNE